MKTPIKALMIATELVSALVSMPAVAKEKGDWLFRFGGSYVNPDSNNHPVVGVDGAGSLTFNFSYMISNHWSAEILLATPFTHDITLNSDGSKVAETKHLPPTISLQYHFVPGNKFSPYIGLGVNYTRFFDTETTGALEGVRLDLSSSLGLAGELGADFMINDKWFINGSIRYMDIETEAALNANKIGTVKIDPWVYGAHVGLRW